MKLMFGPPLVHLLLCFATQTLSVKIHTVPEINGDGVVQIHLDRTVSLVCQPESGYMRQAGEELVWLRNGAPINLKEGNKEGRSSVCVSPAIHKDNGANFTCHLSKNATVSDSVILNVTYPPQLSGSESITVEEESDLLLECDILANPRVISLSWTLNGSQVDLSASGFTVTTDGVTTQLLVKDVQRGIHEGVYKCSANSSIYGVRTKVFNVSLTDKTIKFPLVPMIAGLVVVGLTAILAIVARWKRIAKCFKCKK